MKQDRVETNHQVIEADTSSLSQLEADRAWLVGFACNKVAIEPRKMVYRGNNSHAKAQLVNTGRRVLGIGKWQGTDEEVTPDSPLLDRPSIVISKGDMHEKLGDLRRGRWPETVREMYGDQLQDPDFARHFITGYFDAAGSVSETGSGRNVRITLGSSQEEGCDTLLDVLDLIGIRDAIKVVRNKEAGLYAGVCIGRAEDIVEFVHIVEPRLPNKKKQLDEALLRGKKIAESRLPIRIQPSEELAWILGMLPMGGSVDEASGKITKRKSGEDLGQLHGFRDRMRVIFDLPVHERIIRRENRSDIHEVSFTKKELTEKLGYLKRKDWGAIIEEKHQWIYSQPDYMWSFLRAMFENAGNVNSTGDSRSKLNFYEPTEEGRTVLIKMLDKLGFEGMSVARQEDRLIGIEMYRKGEIQEFARQVSSLDDEKESRLQEWREAEVEPFKPRVVRLSAYAKVMRIREETGWGAARIIKSPELEGEDVPLKTVEGWIYDGKTPYNHAIVNTRPISVDM